jgi:hypothetical protein
MSAACGADAPVGLDEGEDFTEAGAQPTRPRPLRWCAKDGAEDAPELGGGSGEGPLVRQATKPSGRTSRAPPDPMPSGSAPSPELLEPIEASLGCVGGAARRLALRS